MSLTKCPWKMYQSNQFICTCVAPGDTHEKHVPDNPGMDGDGYGMEWRYPSEIRSLDVAELQAWMTVLQASIGMTEPDCDVLGGRAMDRIRSLTARLSVGAKT